MNWQILLSVLLAVCEFVGVGLVGGVVLRLLRRFPVVVPFAGVIVITVVAMATGTAMLTIGLPERTVGEPVVIAMAGVAAIGVGLLLGAPVMRDGQQLVRGRVEEQRLAAEVDELFAPHRIQARGIDLHRTPVRLGELVGDAVTGAGEAAEAGGARLWAGWVDPAVLSVDRAEIARAIDNLLMNAIQCGRGGTVSVDAWAGESRITVSVSGESGGDSTEEGDRASAADNRRPKACDYRGVGLRLAIVQGIVHAHGGELSVHEIPGGCRFELLLPVGSVP
ncbi:ATP-binding protein [Saccharopolyspora shandongensis]|uniref:sensor histidine kinase n=1 Tax=Saccharopolyspora shandongensis TaxID=418495 RepID=UPI003444095E